MTGPLDLKGRTIFISGASRGIGLAIALRAARDGANIAIAAKTAVANPRLNGTIYSAVQEVERAGGKALPIVVDIRDDTSVQIAVDQAANHFGGIDICVNNASAIHVADTLATDAKRYDLMHQVNARGTYMLSRACIPYLKESENPHVLALSPPLHLRPDWLARFPAYAVSKLNMSLYMLAMAEEFRSSGIAFNGLWPRTAIATTALSMGSGDEGQIVARKPEIMAEAACAIFRRPARACTGRFLLDDEVLWEEGWTDFTGFETGAGKPLSLDLFVNPEAWAPPGVVVA